MLSMLSMSELNLRDKRVLIRADLNVPIQGQQITSDFRVQASLPAIHSALAEGAAVIVVSHLGRPKAGLDSSEQPEFSMAPIADWLQGALGQEIALIEDWEKGIDVSPGQLVLLENIRFKRGETENDPGLAKKLASLCDIFVMDAFGVAHRTHASTFGVIEQAEVACAGPLLTAEVEALKRARDRATQPMMVLMGGAKVSGKLKVLSTLHDATSKFMVGGGIANTLLAAAGYRIGQSLYEPGYLLEAKKLLASDKFILPEDVVVANPEEPYTEIATVPIKGVSLEQRILDIGPKTQELYAEHIQSAGTLIWNGPMGLFENSNFATGTRAVGVAAANSNAFSITGGGDTLAAIEKFGILDGFSLISTGGGAFLEFMEGKPLPAVTALMERGNRA